MLKPVLAACVALILSSTAFAAGAQTPEPPVQVMIVGSYHFDNPGRDLNNVEADSMTSPRRQTELDALGRRLAAFRPTAIAVERVANNPELRDQGFERHTPGDYARSSDERIQIGYRLADLTGVGRVYAIDEQASEGKADYFPYGAVMEWADANGATSRLQALNDPIQAHVRDLSERQRTDTVGDILADMNRPDHEINIGGQGIFYYQYMRFGHGHAQPGAELNGRWFTRNAYIFAKLMQVAEPGDRIVVVYGAGHNFWLRHFVETTPGFELVEASPWLAEPDE